ncbi:hypothetical protein J6590_035229 [Homalodisca vitripennis]|nr:hypothetical protein J6590_035229 [Homalodisca vitripennis]
MSFRNPSAEKIWKHSQIKVQLRVGLPCWTTSYSGVYVTERECEELRSPALGTVTLTGRLFNDRATYSCELGYHVGLPVTPGPGDSDVDRSLVQRQSYLQLRVGLPSWTTSYSGVYVTERECEELRSPALGTVTFDRSPIQRQSYLQLRVGLPCVATSYSDIHVTERECEELRSPALGTVTLTGRLFNDRATYSCELGYHVVGLKERTCQADGNWSGQAPVCKQNVYCKNPPHIDHARHNALPEQTTFDLDATIQYQCLTGYVTNGFPRAKCLAIDNAASWFGPDISCERQ